MGNEQAYLTRPSNVVRSWSTSGKLRTLRPQIGVALNAQFQDVANYTAQFFLPTGRLVPAHGKAIPAVGFRAIARVTWWVKGNPIKRVFHVGDGTSIVGTADAVDIQIVDDTRATSGYADVDYDAVIAVTKGTRGSHKQPVFYDFGQQTVAPAASPSVEIPDDIGSIAILVTATTDNPVIPLGAGDAVIAIDNGLNEVMRWDPFLTQDWLPLPPDALNITYAVDATLGAASVVFTTFFGIDG